MNNHVFSRNHFLPFTTLILCIGGMVIFRYFERPSFVFSFKMHDIITVFLSVVIEASPFLLLGSLVAVIVRRTSLISILLRRIPKNPLWGLPVSAALGTLLPVCECGNMPIARSLVKRGFPAPYATTFLFAAPILNPAVFFSTWVAFRGQPIFIAARFALGFIVAVAVGAYVLFQEKRGVKIWNVSCDLSQKMPAEKGHDHTHEHGTSFSSQVFGEFLAIFPYLVIGALFTALFQAYVPREIFFNSDFGIAIAILFMMLFAFVISVCSNTDAFLALGFTGIMPGAALISFLVFGAMIDAKNVLIYSRIFTVRGLLLVSFFVAELVFLLSLILHKLSIV